jgi:hypothetical protein
VPKIDTESDLSRMNEHVPKMEGTALLVELVHKLQANLKALAAGSDKRRDALSLILIGLCDFERLTSTGNIDLYLSNFDDTRK